MNMLIRLFRRFRHPEPDELINRWKLGSLASYWRYEQDWDIPEVRQLAIAAIKNLGLREAARDLGFARCVQGVSITEACQDLRVFLATFSVITRGDALQSLAEGWVAASEGATPPSCTDALTGLSTPDHFKRVLHDTYEGSTVAPHKLVIAKIQLPSVPQGATQRWSVLVRLGKCCETTFKNSGATMTYHRNAVTILMPRTQENYQRVISCQSTLAEIVNNGWESAEVSFEPLPSATSGLLHLMDSLAH